jgi:hypothetical protein
MAAVTAKLVKELRDKTGAGMMDCKKALAATDGDTDKLLSGCAKRVLPVPRKNLVEPPQRVDRELHPHRCSGGSVDRNQL